MVDLTKAGLLQQDDEEPVEGNKSGSLALQSWVLSMGIKTQHGDHS